ncbi:SUMO-targeted ubiquitin ligase complex subunit slx8 [Toensbergia leucococca]|nr:SUMO-targeted ubiquitin ligase complex subunit slx8 [Toensbergia leucococca]
MPASSVKRKASQPRTLKTSSAAPSNPAKRNKTGAGPSTELSPAKDEHGNIEEVDLRDVNDDKGLMKLLDQQRVDSIKAQKEQADKPLKISTLQCIICMEPMTNITVTHCGHLFCHTCLMEALIAGEQQGPDPGKGPSRCPVCRKKVIRPKEGKDLHQIIPLEIKVMTKNKGKTKF